MLIRKNLEFSPRSFVRPFVRKYLEIRSLLFSETLQLVRTRKGEKNVPSTFLKKNPVSPILAKNCSKLAIWLDVWNSLFKGWKSLKNLKVGVFGTDFKQVPFVFQQATCTFWMLGTCRKFGCLSLYFDNFFARKTVGSRETPQDGLLYLEVFYPMFPKNLKIANV